MKPLAKFVIGSLAIGGGYAAIPREIRIQLPGPHQLVPAKKLTTVTLEQAMASPRAGYVTVTFLYLSNLPPNVAVELANDVKGWREKGVAVRAYSIDPVPWKGEIASYVRDIGLDVTPTWIEMPDGAACAFNQMAAVKYFSNRDVDPQVRIPLLTLALTDRDGRIVSTYAIEVPNGGEFDPSEFNGALMSFNNSVTRATRAPATPVAW
jgi:hypothetical protein